MNNVRQLPVQPTSTRPAPKRIMRPCDFGLWGAVRNMETEVGTVEAYNRLCNWAESLKAKIDRGDAKAQNPIYATDPKFIYPAGGIQP